LSESRCKFEAIANNLRCVTYLKKIKFEFSAVVIFFPVLWLNAACRKVDTICISIDINRSTTGTMTYSCYVCRQLIPGDIRCLFTHLRTVHFVCELRNVTLKCGQGDCVRCYSTFNSLARHLRYEHSGESATVSNDISLNDDGIDVAASGSVDGAMVSVSCNEPVDAPVVRDKSFGAASFVASLLSSSTVTERTVQCVIEHTSALVNDIVHDIANDVKNTMGSASTECEGLLSRIQQYASPFNAINSQYKRNTYFQKQYGMVPARSIFLGNRFDQCLDPATGSMRQVVKRDTFQYVPLLKLIELLLSDNSIRRETMTERVSVDGLMYDFSDGSLYSTIPLFAEDKSALQLCLYFDECEVVNPLGSRKGIHKIGFIYLSLRNVKPMFNSRLSNIHIVAAFNCLDRSVYGFGKILAPIVADLKQLEHGVDFTLRDGTVVHKRGTVVQIVGDNLGLHQLCGFVESFSAKHFCRFCMINKADCDTTYTDDGLELRNKEQYSRQVKCLLEGTISTRDCGIKSSCLLNSLQYFHVVQNVSVDVMHDLLEGIVPFELKLILASFIFDKKYFSLQVLNARLASFDYGYLNRRNKPTALIESELRDQQKTSLSQKASQTMCLVSVLPFLIGFEVPENDDMWKLYLLLRDIIDLVFSDVCAVGDSVYLKAKIEDHHALFRTVFPDRNMLAKHHILIHYPQVMRKVGPLSRCSSIRFEAKHNEAKRLCGVVGCFKDICKTVVHRHQINQCVRIAAGNCASYEVTVQKVEVCPVNELPEADSIMSSVAGLQRFDDISHAAFVSVCGTEYRKNMVIVVDVGDEPSFCKIVRCLVVMNNRVYFVCQDLRIKYHDDHMHAYVVEQGDSVRVVEQRCLKHYEPLSINCAFGASHEYVAFP